MGYGVWGMGYGVWGMGYGVVVVTTFTVVVVTGGASFPSFLSLLLSPSSPSPPSPPPSPPLSLCEGACVRMAKQGLLPSDGLDLQWTRTPLRSGPLSLLIMQVLGSDHG
jgi:hypothetical protein